MKVNYDAKELKIYAENSFERKLLCSKYLKTKLSYVLIESPIPGCKITIGEGMSSFNLEKEEVHIDNRYSESQIGYILRIIVDAYVLWKNALPLHAAMLSTPEKNIFIFGNTHGGKTSLANNLRNVLPCATLVGDDHVIVSEAGVIGNAIARVRTIQNLEEVYVENFGKGSINKAYVIIDVDCNCLDTTVSKTCAREYIKRDLSYITKYIEDDFITKVEAIYVDRFVGKDIKNAYMKALIKFIEQAESILYVRGDLQKIQESLIKQLDTKTSEVGFI